MSPKTPRVALLVDHYDDDDWSALWWVRADGDGRRVELPSEEGRHAVGRLRDRYLAYVDQPPTGPVMAIDVRRWSGWTGRGDHVGDPGLTGR